MRYFTARSLPLVYSRKINLVSRPVFFAFIITVFTACGTQQPPVHSPQQKTIFINMISIPGGSFTMGSPQGSGLMIERPSHQVTLRSYLLAQHEVTQGQYFEITGLRPSSCRTNPEDRSPEGWKNLPVEMVNWYEALIFCNKLSVKENFSPVYRVNGSVNPNDWGDVPAAEADAEWNVEWISGANGYRLPTESEWEYAARGGPHTRSHKYAGSDDHDHVSWYYENSATMSHHVGKKTPNELDLYDMSGNVMEWCWDWQGMYTADAKENPRGPTSGLDRIVRGGGWSYAVVYGLVSYRHYNHPYYRGVNLGFRVARSE